MLRFDICIELLLNLEGKMKEKYIGSPENEDAGCCIENDGVQKLLKSATKSFYHCAAS